MIVAGPCLYESGLIPKKLSFMEDAEVLNYGIGMSNIVPRTTRSASELSRSMRNKTLSLYYVQTHSEAYEKDVKIIETSL